MAQTHYWISRPGALLKVTGEDAPSYLQGQCSNDLRHPGVAHPVTYGLWLDPKGKVQADSFVLQVGQTSFLLLSYFCQSDLLQATIGSNIIADEVTIEDLTDSAWLVSFWGESAVGKGPPTGEFRQDGACYCFAGRRSTLSGEILSLYPSDLKAPELSSLNPETMRDFAASKPTPSFQPSLSQDALTAMAPGLLFDDSWVQVGLAEAEAERIRCGIPAIPQDIGPGDLPQEAGLETVALSFQKGCYLGQEVMARLQTRGQTQRRLYRVSLATPPVSLPEPIFSDDKPVGELRSAWGFTGFALLKCRVVANGSPLCRETSQGKSEVFLDLNTPLSEEAARE